MFEPLPDIPRLYTGLAEWGACLVYVLLVIRGRFTPRLFAGAPLSLASLIGVQLLADSLPEHLWVPGMISAVLVMAASISVMSAVGMRMVWHLTFRAFIAAEFVASLHWQLTVFFLPEQDPHSPGSFAVVVIFYAIVLTIVGLLENRNFVGDEPPSIEPADLALGAAITLVTFAMSNLSFVSTSTPFSGRLGPEVFYIRTLVDLVGCAALYAQHERIVQMGQRTELASIHAALDAQHNQYLQSKAAFDAIGRAHHDLKHQISVLRAELDPEDRAQHFEELERSINSIASQYHCGNPVLDVILTSKASVCVASDIEFTTVADGSLLQAMTSMDIATLFGNALDNAIEASKRVADPTHRIIKLALHAKGRLIIIRVENWFTGELDPDEHGNLRTLKSNRSRHGFGVKSIRWTARKYGGEVTTNVDGQWFILTIVLPNQAPIRAD